MLPRRYELGFRGEFLWQGTGDFTAWLAAPACIEVQRALGPQRITSYNHALVKQATAMLLEAWGTHMALGVSQDGRTAGLVAIQLPWPLDVRGGSSKGENSSSSSAPPVVRVAVNGARSCKEEEEQQQQGGGPTPADAAALNLLLRQQHCIEVPVACVSGILFVRISAQVYNSMAEYGRLRDVVSSLRL